MDAIRSGQARRILAAIGRIRAAIRGTAHCHIAANYYEEYRRVLQDAVEVSEQLVADLQGENDEARRQPEVEPEWRRTAPWKIAQEEQQDPGMDLELESDPEVQPDGPGRNVFCWDEQSIQDLKEGRHPRQVKQK